MILLLLFSSNNLNIIFCIAVPVKWWPLLVITFVMYNLYCVQVKWLLDRSTGFITTFGEGNLSLHPHNIDGTKRSVQPSTVFFLFQLQLLFGIGLALRVLYPPWIFVRRVECYWISKYLLYMTKSSLRVFALEP